jgi:sodium-coupled neutral amino acid transporter 11
MGLMAAFVMVLIYRMHVPFAGSTLVDTTPSMESRPRGTVSLESFLTNLSGVPIITFAFSCHVCIFPIYNTLEQPTVGRMSMVILLAVSMCMCLYGMVSIVGQFVFGDQICPNLLNNFRVDDPLLGAMRVAFAISIAAGYPFALFAARRSLDMLVFPKASLQGMSTLRFRTEALALALVALMLAALVPGVRVVFAFTGSMFATTLAFIVPALCYLRLAESLDCMAYLSIVVFIVGVALGTFSTLANVMTIIAGDPTPKGCLSAGACTITHP